MVRKRKAVTPVIAIIVLLLITIALTGAAWTFISGYWSGTTEKQIEVVDSFCIGAEQAKILIRNMGTGVINTGEIIIMDKASGNDITNDVLWTSGVTDPSLVLELKFEEGTGNFTKDTSGKRNDGTLMPAGSEPVWINGKIGGALDFDGINSYIDLPELEADIENDGMGTISAWIRSQGGVGLKNIFSHSDLSTFYRHMSLRLSSGGVVLQYYYMRQNVAPGPDNFALQGTTSIGAAWVHVAVTSDGISHKMYVNGLEEPVSVLGIDTGQWFNDLGNYDFDDFVGKFESSSGPANFFNGYIDDVRIYDRALSSNEIKALADNAVALPPGEIATITHTCNGRCDISLLMGGYTRTAIVQC